MREVKPRTIGAVSLWLMCGAWTPANGLASPLGPGAFDRLDPVVSTYGYANVTLVLDSIPWGLPAPGTAALGSLGQKTPAQYPSLALLELQADVHRINQPLRKQHRQPIPGFEMGTEYNDEGRFNGTLTQCLQMYDWCARGVRKPSQCAALARSMGQAIFRKG